MANVKALLMTHDLWCVIGQLETVACRYSTDATTDVTSRRGRDLAIAAIAFTIQLAIDNAARDPAAMRSLERELFALFTDEAT